MVVVFCRNIRKQILSMVDFGCVKYTRRLDRGSSPHKEKYEWKNDKMCLVNNSLLEFYSDLYKKIELIYCARSGHVYRKDNPFLFKDVVYVHRFYPDIFDTYKYYDSEDSSYISIDFKIKKLPTFFILQKNQCVK